MKHFFFITVVVSYLVACGRTESVSSTVYSTTTPQSFLDLNIQEKSLIRISAKDQSGQNRCLSFSAFDQYNLFGPKPVEWYDCDRNDQLTKPDGTKVFFPAARHRWWVKRVSDDGDVNPFVIYNNMDMGIADQRAQAFYLGTKDSIFGWTSLDAIILNVDQFKESVTVPLVVENGIYARFNLVKISSPADASDPVLNVIFQFQDAGRLVCVSSNLKTTRTSYLGNWRDYASLQKQGYSIVKEKCANISVDKLDGQIGQFKLADWQKL